MRSVTLRRLCESDRATYGEILISGVKFVTIERGWHRNRPFVSCIPAGVYTCDFVFSPKFKRKTYLLNGVFRRTEIRIHPANLPEEVEGCIGLGRFFGEINGQKAAMRSKVAVEHFEQILDSKPFELQIVDIPGTSRVMTGSGYRIVFPA